ncbi:zinc finger DNA binding protein [Gordonia phage SteveFrench]|uniref:C2H2-type domain-containing protein n=2 Tax=Montyvirus stevefrench TaxID=2734258 RepID=A0A890UPV8_9CAUD|nr:zinc finger DNA binding protein [Gordonia phage SteveFrench]AUV60662.1 hypothetical protein SEA_STEVEFRENCH_60 [Gordonia phage SteveFrench]QRI45645.1 hypothetical protein SEA_ROYALG_61 [Gordonia phage RoyalG]
MPDNDFPEEFQQALAFQRFQQKQYEEASRKKEESHNADLAAFSSFIDELGNDQLDFLHDLIGELGATAYAFKLQGIIVGARVYRRGRMVDGQTYEAALGLGGKEERPDPHVFDNIVKAIDELPDEEPSVEDAAEVLPAFNGPLEGEFSEEETIPPKPPEPKMVSETRTYDVGQGVVGIKHGKQPLMCASCSKPYASVEDMREHVERDGGCKGCQNKAKWG